MHIDDIPLIRQVPSAIGQLDLLETRKSGRESRDPEQRARCLRRCNRCGDLDQARQPSVYDAAEYPGGCPVCHYNEFSVVEENHEMVTATSGTLRIKPGTSKAKSVATRQGHSPSADPAASRPATTEVMGELINVERDLIQISPDNPRRYFDPIALQELADSIRDLGLLQPILLGRCGGIFELIAGERRFRAAEVAGLACVPSYVREMTPEQVTAARLAENLKREDLSEIEEARAYKAAIDRHGWTQSQLAEKVSVTQGQVSNRIRLLTLPEAWINRVISHEMHATQARDLIPYADVPKVFVALEKAFKKKHPKDLTAEEWDCEVLDAIEEASERLTGSKQIGLSYISFDLGTEDAELLKGLDIREVKNRWGRGTERRAFNLPAWKAASDAQIEKLKKKQDKKLSKAVDAKKKTAPTAEDLKKKAEQHNKRLYRHKIAFLQTQIATRVEQLEQEDFLVFLMAFALTNGRDRRDMFEKAATAVGMPALKAYAGESEIWNWVVGLDRGKFLKMFKNYFAQWCTLEAKSWSSDANPAAIETVAKSLELDLADWRVSEDFLKLHTVDQLMELLAEWKLLNLSNGTKADLIKTILSSDMNKKLPPPKELLNVTACILD